MKTEEVDIANMMCKIDAIRFSLVCKILNYELGDTSAVDALASIAQIDEKEAKHLRDLINSIFSEVEKQPTEKVMEAVRERISHVLDWVCKMRLNRFLILEKMIIELSRPVKDGKPIAELKEKTTEVIKLIQAGGLKQEALKDYMDLEISKICLYRELREYEELWEQAKDASTNETVEFIYQTIQKMEDKMKADFESYDFEQNEIAYTINEVNKMIEDSLSEAGVQDENERAEIHKDLTDVFNEQDISYRGSGEWYKHVSESAKNLNNLATNY